MNNSGITLVDVRQEAFDTIRKLKDKTMDVKTASEIRNLLNTVIDTAKTQVEFIKSIPSEIKAQMSTDEVKAIAGTLSDRDADMDLTMKSIKDNNSQPVRF